MTSPPKALPPTGHQVLALDDDLIRRAITASRAHPRGRIILPLHDRDEAPLHRMLNAMQPGSYVRPHRHLDPPKAESWIVLRGRVLFGTFDAEGGPTGRYVLAPDGGPFGMDLVPGIFHTLAALAPDTVLFEVKPGPWSAASDKEFAPWAPPEGSPEADGWLRAFLEHE